mgnify:FL=1
MQIKTQPDSIVNIIIGFSLHAVINSHHTGKSQGKRNIVSVESRKLSVSLYSANS